MLRKLSLSALVIVSLSGFGCGSTTSNTSATGSAAGASGSGGAAASGGAGGAASDAGNDGGASVACPGLQNVAVSDLNGSEWTLFCQCANQRIKPGTYPCDGGAVTVTDTSVQQCAQSAPQVFTACNVTVDTYLDCLTQTPVCGPVPGQCQTTAACTAH